MTRDQLAARLAEQFSLKKSDAKLFVIGTFDIIAQELSDGEKVTISDFGNFQLRQTKARMGRNPATGETIKIPAKRKLVWRPAKALKDSV